MMSRRIRQGRFDAGVRIILPVVLQAVDAKFFPDFTKMFEKFLGGQFQRALVSGVKSVLLF